MASVSSGATPSVPEINILAGTIADMQIEEGEIIDAISIASMELGDDVPGMGLGSIRYGSDSESEKSGKSIKSTESPREKPGLTRTMTAVSATLQEHARQSMRAGEIDFQTLEKEFGPGVGSDEIEFFERIEQNNSNLSKSFSMLRGDTPSMPAFDRCGSTTTSVHSNPHSTNYGSQMYDDEYVELTAEQLPTDLESALEVIKEQDNDLYQHRKDLGTSAQLFQGLIVKLRETAKERLELFELSSKLETELHNKDHDIVEKEKSIYLLTEDAKKKKQELAQYRSAFTYINEEKAGAMSEAENLKEILVQKTEEAEEKKRHLDMVWAKEKVMENIHRIKRDKHLTTLKTRAEELEKELEEVKKKNAEALELLETEKIEATGKLADLASQVEKTEHELSEARNNLEQNEARAEQKHGAEIASLNTIVESLRDACKELEDKLKKSVESASAKDEIMNSLKATIHEKERKITSLGNKMSEREKSNAEQTNSLRIALEHKEESLKIELQEFKERLSEKDRAAELLEDKITETRQSADAAAAELHKKIELKEHEKEELRERLGKEAGKRLESKLAEAQRRHSETEKKLQQTTAQLTEQEAREVLLSEEMDAKSDRIFRMQSQIEQNLGEAEQLAESLKIAEDQHTQAMERATNEATYLKKQVAQKETDLKLAKQEVNNCRTDALSKKESYDQHRRAQQQQLSELQEKLETTEISYHRFKEEATYNEKATRASLEKKTEEHRTAGVKLTSNEQTIKSLEAQERQLQQEIQNLKNDCQSRDNELDELRESQRRSLQKFNEAISSAKGSLEKEKDQRDSEVNDLKRSLQEERKTLAETEQRLTVAASKWKLAAEEARVSGEKRFKEAKLDYQRRIDASQTRLQEVRQELSDEQTKVTRLKRDTDQARIDRKQWEKDMREKQSEQRAEEMQKVQSFYASAAEDSHNQMKGEAEILRMELKQEQQRANDLQEKLTESQEVHKEDTLAARKKLAETIASLTHESQEEIKRLSTALQKQTEKTKEELEKVVALETKLGQLRVDYQQREELLKAQVKESVEKAEENVRWTAKHLNAEKQDQQTLVEQSQQAQTGLQAAMLSSSNKEKMLEDHITALDTKIGALGTDAALSQSLIATLRLEVAELNTNLLASQEKALRVESEAAQKIEQLQQQVRGNREKEVRLELRVQQLSQSNQEGALQIQRGKEGAAQAAEEAAAARAQERELARKVHIAEAAATKRNDEANELELQLREARKELGETQGELQMMQKRRAQDAEDQRREAEDAKHRAKLHQHEPTSPDTAYSPRRDELTRLHQNYTQLLHAMKQKERECEVLTERLDDREAQLQDMERSWTYKVGRAQDNSNSQSGVITELQDALQEAEATTRALMADVDAHVALETQLRKEIGNLQAAKSTAEASERAAVCKSVEHEVRARHVEELHHNRVRKVREDHKSEAHILQEQATEAAEQIAELQRTLRSYRRFSEADNTDSAQNRTREDATIDGLRHDVAVTRADLEATRADLQTERARATQLETELHSARRGIGQHRSVTHRLRTELSDVEAALVTAEQSRDAMERQFSDSRKEYDTGLRDLMSKLDVSMQRCEEADQQRHDMEEERVKADKEAEVLRANLQKIESQRGSVHAQLAQDSLLREQLADEVKQLQTRQHELISEAEEAKRQQRESHENLATSRDCEHRLRHELEEMESRSIRLRETVVQSAAVLEKLEMERLSMEEAIATANAREANLRQALRRNNIEATTPGATHETRSMSPHLAPYD